MLAMAGPVRSNDFDAILSPLLVDRRVTNPSGRGDKRTIRFNCTATFVDTTPSFVLSRVSIGRLVSIGASIRLQIARLDAKPPKRLATHRSPSTDVRVEFGLETTTDEDPENISRALGLVPTATLRKGELGAHAGRPSRSMRWKYVVGPRRDLDFGACLEEMLSVIQPRTNEIASLTTHRVEGILSFVGYFSGISPELVLTAEHLDAIRRLGLEVDADLMHSVLVVPESAPST